MYIAGHTNRSGIIKSSLRVFTDIHAVIRFIEQHRDLATNLALRAQLDNSRFVGSPNYQMIIDRLEARLIQLRSQTLSNYINQPRGHKYEGPLGTYSFVYVNPDLPLRATDITETMTGQSIVEHATLAGIDLTGLTRI